MRLADVFRARVVDTTLESFVFELTGAPEKVDAFIALMRPLGLSRRRPHRRRRHRPRALIPGGLPVPGGGGAAASGRHEASRSAAAWRSAAVAASLRPKRPRSGAAAVGFSPARWRGPATAR